MAAHAAPSTIEAAQHIKNSGVETLAIAESAVPNSDVDTKSNMRKLL